MGQGGNNTLIESGNVNFVLTDSTLTGNSSDKLQHIQIARLTGGIDNNRLDASAFTGTVFLDGGAGNDTVKGGSGGGVLIGGVGNDKLTAKDGRNLLFGGAGLDKLLGGNGEDILFNGTTTFESNRAAVDALFTQWNRADLDYQPRVDLLRTGANGAPKFDASTVKNDSSSETLSGGGLDWFFVKLANPFIDLIADLETNEKKN
jgi:Ca2+-binding RTX toxin-like protein